MGGRGWGVEGGGGWWGEWEAEGGIQLPLGHRQ